MPTQSELRAPLHQRLEMALEDLAISIDGGAEFPDAAFATAEAWSVPQAALEAAYDGAQ